MKYRFLKQLFTIIAIVVITATLSGCRLFGGGAVETPAPLPEYTLKVWGLFDDEEVFAPIIRAFQGKYASKLKLTVEYKKKNYQDYVETTVDSLASKKGPDVWMIRNDWLPKHYEKLVSVPEKTLTLESYQQTYPPVVIQDTVIDGKIYAIPWSVDTLSIFYNRNIFEEKRTEMVRKSEINPDDKTLVFPPNDWEEFIRYVKLLTIKDGGGIQRAGAALGTAGNVDRSIDILTALMLQNHTNMISDDKKSAAFNLYETKAMGEPYYPGIKALEFYKSFSDPSKEVYTWNNSMSNSVQAFIEGKTAMIFHYAFLRKYLFEKAPTLNYGIGPLPQIKDEKEPIDFSSYWVETVTGNCEKPDIAWDFIFFVGQQSGYYQATSRSGPYLPDQGQIPMLRDRAKNQNNAFTFQLASAKNWYKGKFPNEADTIFTKLIDSVTKFGQDTKSAIDSAANDVTTLLQKE